MATRQLTAALLLMLGVSACNKTDSHKQEAGQTASVQTDSASAPGTFGYDLQFLRKHGRVVELASADSNARVIVSPVYQGRVMTSTASGTSTRLSTCKEPKPPSTPWQNGYWA